MVIRRWLSGVMLPSLLLFFFSLSFPCHKLFAEEASDKPSDVRIIIDISGSMKETDPQNLRVPALNLLVELLPDGSQAGVWTFGRMVNMLVPLGPVNQSWRDQAKNSANKINSVGLRTNLTEALDKAQWKIAADSGFDHSVILLTDGKIDMAESGQAADSINNQQKQKLLTQVLPQYIEAGARIHTLALSQSADIATLQQISLETGGLFLQAENADELLKAFLKAFDRAVPVEQVPMQDNRFEIDETVREFTALIFRSSSSKETSLVTPEGDVINRDNSRNNDQVRWHHDLNFDLITVKDPQSGSWAADADIDPDNRVQILTDLKLRVTGLPSSIFAGYPINLEMALTEKDELVSEPTILALTDFTLAVTAPDGRTGSKLLSDPEALPEDGVFRESLTRLSQQGEYRIEVTASGRTFQRKQVLTAALMEPLAVSAEPDYDNQILHIRVTPQVENVDTSLSRVIAKVTSPDDSSVIHSMEFDADSGSWYLPLRADKGDGAYSALLNIRGVTANGSTFKSKPESIDAQFPLLKPGQMPAVAAESGDLAVIGSDSVSGAEKPNLSQPVVEEIASEPVQAETVPAEAEQQVEPAEAAPPEEEPPAPEPEKEPEIAPDLAKKFEQQVSEGADEEITEESVAWWLYLLLALGNLTVFGGAAFWWLRKRKSVVAQQTESSPAAKQDAKLPPDLESDFDEADLEGDFDAFDDDGEEEISLPSGAAPMSSGDDEGLGLDDDFALDGDDDALGGEDDWGEFDEPGESSGDKKEE